MLKERVISALVGAPIVIAFLFLGKYFFAFLVAVIVALGIDELYSMLVARELKPNIITGVVGSIAIVAGALVGGVHGVIFMFVLTVIVTLVWHTFSEAGIVNTALTITGPAYIAIPLSHLLFFFELKQGVIGILLVFVATWLSDIAAYSFGRAMGKRKLAPSISANKTVEGGVAGLIVPAILLGVIFVLPWLPFAASEGVIIALLKGVGFGIVIGVVAPLGDLVESRVKREMRVKDSGALIPGHGGLLDRFDSAIVTSVAGYYYWLFII